MTVWSFSPMVPTGLSSPLQHRFPMTTYYVSNSGVDTNNGTSTATPWKTVTKVNSVSFAAGDQILFNGGQTFTGKLTFGVGDAGTTANPIVVGSYGTSGTRATISSGTDKAISIYNIGGVTVDNLICSGVGRASGNLANGIEVFGDIGGTTRWGHIKVTNCQISGYGKDEGAGIWVQAWPNDNTASGWDKITIEDNEVFSCSDNGIKIYPSNPDAVQTTKSHFDVQIRRNLVYNIPGRAAATNHSGSGILAGGIDGYTNEYNITHNCGGTGGGGYGNWLWQTTNFTMQFNESYSNDTNGPDGGGFDLDGGCQNGIVQFNYAHDNSGPGFLLMHYTPSQTHNNNVVRYNISKNDARKHSAGIKLLGTFGTITNDHVYNNVVYAASSSTSTEEACITIEDSTSSSVRNNIFMVNSAQLLRVSGTNTGLLIQGNLYYASGAGFSVTDGGTTYTSLGAWRTGKSREKVSTTDVGIFADPLLASPATAPTVGSTSVNGLANALLSYFSLTSGSPAINTGLDLFTLFSLSVGTRDFFGRTIPQGSGYDIGAYESGLTRFNPISNIAYARFNTPASATTPRFSS